MTFCWLRWGWVGAMAIAATAGCGDDAVTDGEGGGGSGGEASGGGSNVVTLTPAAEPLPGQSACEVTITTGIPISGQTHVEACTDVDYATNPPSSGNHWGVWAAFMEYAEPIPREMYVHSLEHGAVVLLHDCEGCDGVVEALRDAAEGHGIDPKCITEGVQNRTLVAPDPEIDHPIALAAWGATLTATCIDPESLSAFVDAHYAQGPEDLCAAGKDPTDPLSGAPICD